MRETSPDCVAIENLFHAKNVRSALVLGHARGVAVLAAVQAGVPLVEYTPAEIKLAVVGYGRADKVQIQQVLLNLLRNAVEAMEASQRRELVISTAAGDDDMVAVSVADTGSGIAPELMSQLFQPFVTNKRQGMGVGLSICRTIVEAHGGQITVEPNPDGGTIFRFTLRAAREEDFSDAA